ncbi:MAG: hypothetical protein OSJ45_13945 [Lachnospiraceae bacterium]|nr:hypothetical protein [Lachnospiraceae bacterium]
MLFVSSPDAPFAWNIRKRSLSSPSPLSVFILAPYHLPPGLFLSPIPNTSAADIPLSKLTSASNTKSFVVFSTNHEELSQPIMKMGG